MASNSIQGPAFWKVRLCSGNNHNPHAPWLRKATLAFFSPSALVSRGQRGAGLPLAPWALLLCWWSPEVETHSKRVLLPSEAGIGTKMATGRWPQQTPRASYGVQHRGPISPTAPNSIQGAAFWKGRLSLGNKPQPQCAFAQQSNACLFLPKTSGLHRPKRVWAASGSLGPAALLVVS